MIVSVSLEAERELIDGALFYTEQATTELGLVFIAEFERALEILREEVRTTMGLAGRTRIASGCCIRPTRRGSTGSSASTCRTKS